MLIARIIQTANMPSELQPEAMCNAIHAMTSSEYRSGLQTVRAHVSAMCTHVVALCLHVPFEIENESVAGGLHYERQRQMVVEFIIMRTTLP